MALTVVHGDQHSKGLLPDPGYRRDLRAYPRRRRTTSPYEMMRLQQQFGEIILRDPDVAGHGLANRHNRQPQSAQYRAASPSCSNHATSAKRRRAQIIDRLRPQFAQVQGANVFLQPAQDINVGAPHRPRQLPVHAAGRQCWRSWSNGRRRCSTRCGRLPHDRRRVERSAGQRAAAQGHHQPRPGRALRHHAADDRRHAQRRLRPAPDQPVLHAAQYLFDHPRNPARAAEDP